MQQLHNKQAEVDKNNLVQQNDVVGLEYLKNRKEKAGAATPAFSFDAYKSNSNFILHCLHYHT